MASDEPCDDRTLLTLEEQICAAYNAAMEYDPEIVRLQALFVRNTRPVVKFADSRPYADPDNAARKLVEIANSIEPARDGGSFIELINARFLMLASPKEYGAGLTARSVGLLDRRRRDP